MNRRLGAVAIILVALTALAAVWSFVFFSQPVPKNSAATETTAAKRPSSSETINPDTSEPPTSLDSMPLVVSAPRSDQPANLKPEPPARSPDWKLLDWSLRSLPEKPGIQLRASTFQASGKYPFVRVEQEIEVLPSGEARVLKTVEMVGDQIIVKLPEGSPREEIQSLAAKLGGQAAAKPFAPDTWLVALPRKLEAVPEALAGSTNSGISIDYAEPNHLVRSMLTPNDFYMTNFSQWHLYNNAQTDKDIKAPRAWDRRTSAFYGTTNKVIVAVIDCGVRYTHEDLLSNMWTNPGETAGDGVDNDGNGVVDDVYGADYFGNDGNPMTVDGHGTHCAGLIAAVGNNGFGVSGVAWSGALIMALRFIDGNTGSLSDAIQCIDYAIAKGAKVINASYGSSSRNDTGSGSEAAAIYRAQQAGIVLVAAAGNDGTNNDSTPFFPASYTKYIERAASIIPPRSEISYPLNNIIAVGATDRNDNKASFSNYGSTSVDLMVPGVEMWSTTISGTSDSSYAQGQGTSFAAPVVSGAVALLIAEYPNDTVSQRVGRVVNTNAVDLIPGLNGQCVTGGRLNLAKLLPAADVSTLPQALAWHRPDYTESLISSP
ncbi:MAG: S8 family serine peptidase, partial [Planctomycetes bacterium]|nr:S8 family serine peptidase [Planctomycetota bacterium]